MFRSAPVPRPRTGRARFEPTPLARVQHLRCEAVFRYAVILITPNVGLAIFAAIRCRRAANARRSAISSRDGVFNFLDRGHDFPIQNKRARRRADLWMILFHGREIWRKNLVDDFSIRAILVGRTFF